MGTRTVRVAFCDHTGCTNETNVQTYRLGTADSTIKRLDLCPEHAKPFLDYIGPVKKRKQRSSRQVVDPTTIQH
jgi:hypothetical protein